MTTTLCFDFGNSRLKAAVFTNGKLVIDFILKDGCLDEMKSLINKYQPTKSILTSVIDHDLSIESLLTEHTQFHKVCINSKLNFSTAVSKPDTIGADRLALLAAAADQFPNNNNLIIGMGSCITYNFINQNQVFLGGSISPGMEMRFKAMHDYTAKLPLVQSDWNLPLIGYDTKTNLQSGVVYGIINEIEGFIERYSQKYSNFNPILTGGNTEFFATRLKNKIFADNYFLFKGLYALSELNN
jgi:type III pantothenate kinase